jgi:hypothetical protein
MEERVTGQEPQVVMAPDRQSLLWQLERRVRRLHPKPSVLKVPVNKSFEEHVACHLDDSGSRSLRSGPYAGRV